jgi:hypothetical protein
VNNKDSFGNDDEFTASVVAIEKRSNLNSLVAEVDGMFVKLLINPLFHCLNVEIGD